MRHDSTALESSSGAISFIDDWEKSQSLQSYKNIIILDYIHSVTGMDSRVLPAIADVHVAMIDQV